MKRWKIVGICVGVAAAVTLVKFALRAYVSRAQGADAFFLGFALSVIVVIAAIIFLHRATKDKD